MPEWRAKEAGGRGGWGSSEGLRGLEVAQAAQQAGAAPRLRAQGLPGSFSKRTEALGRQTG